MCVLLVLGVDSSSEGVGGIFDDGLEHALGVGVLVHVGGEDGAEDLLGEDLVLGRGRLHDRRLDEEANARRKRDVINGAS